MAKYAIGCLGVIFLFFVILFIGGCGTYNSIVGLSQNVDGTWSIVQADYQRRADLIPNLVATVKGAANFEKSTLVEITNARASVGQVKLDPTKAPSDPQQFQQYENAQNQLGGALSRLLVVSERYPELKANTNFQNLEASLEGTENRIKVSRMHFIEATQAYNTAIRRFPTMLFAGALGFQPKPYFQASAGSENAPAVNFDFGSGTPATAH